TWMMLIFAVLVGLTAWGFTRLPTGFFPIEDQGYAIVGIQLPDAASQARTRAVVERVNGILRKTPGVRSWFLIGGQSILDQAVAPNAAAMYLTFTPWEERNGKPGLSMEGILGNFMMKVQEIHEAMVFAFPPPAIQGLGVAGGFQMQLEDRGGVGLQELQLVLHEVVSHSDPPAGLARVQSTLPPGG